MQKVFISYSRKDIDFARKLAGDLERAGYDVWWDITDLRGGDDWVRTLPAAIEAARFFIIVLTPNSVESEWVRKEYTQALGLHKKIIPIMLTPCSVPFALNTINYINFSAGEYLENFEKLLSALRFMGKPPVGTSRDKPDFERYAAFRKYVVIIVPGIVLLFTLAWIAHPNSPPPPTETPTLPPTLMLTDTPLPTSTPTATVTASPTATAIWTVTPTRPTLTPSATKQPFETLNYCVNSLYAYNINVRSGPGTNYAVLGEPLSVGTCLAFRAVNEEETWLLIAPNQVDPELQQYAGGWIYRDLLGLGLNSPIDLPAVTLTSTPIPSQTPASTLTFTSTPSATPSLTSTPAETSVSMETPTP